MTKREDPFAVLPKVAKHLGHIQITDAPGRGEPESGKIDWAAILKLIAEVNCTGPIGLELSPTGSDTAAALAWIRALAA